MTALAWAGAASLAGPALRAMLRARARRGKELPDRLDERRGIDATPRPPGRLLWMHAASVGETVSVLPVLAALVARSPVGVLLTTGTVTSAALLARRLPELGLAPRVRHRFVPLDVPAWAARFLDHWRPDAACFVESELWPNLLAGCRMRGIPLMLLNARLSPRSHARWRRLRGLARDVLGGFASIRARSEADAARLRSLGGRAVTAPGDLKFAAPPLPADPAELARLRARLGGRPVWLAASTHPGEETAVLAAHRSLLRAHPGLLTIIVPRHPERGAELLDRLVGAPATRRGRGEDPPGAAGLYVADTLGELGLFYRLAGIAFVGGSLVPHGGQNPLEAARLDCAVAAGPFMDNFAAAVDELARRDGLRRVANATALAGFVDAMLSDPPARRRMAEAAAGAAEGWADLPERSAAALLDLLEGAR